MYKNLTFCVVVLLCLAGAASAFAPATPDAAKAWVKKAAEFYQVHGKEKALAEFSDPKGQSKVFNHCYRTGRLG
jgi:hypothetical protein